MDKSSLNIFTDGAISGNGTSNCYAGYGVYIVETGKKISHKITCYGSCTNQIAELRAIKRAVSYSKKFGNGKCVNIYTDSMYAINSLTLWNKRWKQNGWKNAKGDDVVNRDLIMEIDELINSCCKCGSTVSFFHVRSHKKEPEKVSGSDCVGSSWWLWNGNNIADELAVIAKNK